MAFSSAISMEKYAIFRWPNASPVTVTIPLASPPSAGLLSAKRLACEPHILRYSSLTSNSECPSRFAEIARTAAQAQQSPLKFAQPLQRFANLRHYPLPPPRPAEVRHMAPPQYSAPPSASWMHPTHSDPDAKERSHVPKRKTSSSERQRQTPSTLC